MYIRLDADFRVIESDISLSEGFNTDCFPSGITTDLFRIREIKSGDIAPCNVQYFHDIQLAAYVEDGYMIWVEVPLRDSCEIYISKLTEGWILSNDFWLICSIIDKPTINIEAMKYFEKHRYLDVGVSPVEGICRLEIGKRFYFSNGAIVGKSMLRKMELPKEKAYKLFKNSLLSSIEYFTKTEPSILLSGGVDSALIAAISKIELNYEADCFILDYKQSFKSAKRDVAIASQLAEILGYRLERIEFDFNQSDLNSLNDFVLAMPSSAHIALPFSKLVSNVTSKQFYVGQNADSVYNFGLSAESKFIPPKNLTSMFGRYLYSDLFARSFKKGSFFTHIHQGINVFLLRLYNWRMGTNYSMPRSRQDLINGLKYSVNYFPLLNKYENRTEIDNSCSLRAAMFDAKINTFVNGPDNHVLKICAKQCDKQSLYPYSSNNMLHFFRNLQMQNIDIVKPKRFIHLYLKELLGDEVYVNLFKKKINVSALVDDSDWDSYILSSTDFGRKLSTIDEKSNSINVLVSKYWTRRIEGILSND